MRFRVVSLPAMMRFIVWVQIARSDKVRAVDLGDHEAGDDVVGRVVERPALVDEALDVRAEDRVGVVEAAGLPAALGVEQLVGPRPEALVVLEGDAEHVGDDRRGQRVDDRRDEVDVPVGPLDGPAPSRRAGAPGHG